ncbi:hypothetical protein LEM8419_01547 [Neolewinella maritima]|uniref:DUF1573 domain-containing protein n=1 Tax=Neolewinella maritima TaxID=1383882 RepID=A0ABM9B168_9BACT|nr:DUF1573 domain-containing protein [Neolewinella maritima]CAH1000394.1 hypothetical protein LEM8419_01547 [Neolewinella maritima]
MLHRFAPLLLVLLWSCAQDGPAAELPAQDGEDRTADFVRTAIPPTAFDSAEHTTVSVPATRYDFGRVRAGRTVRHTYAFTNTGVRPLHFRAVRPSCGCTVASYPTAPVPPGVTTEVELTLATAGLLGRQSRPVVFITNTVPAETTVYLSGEVVP